MWDAGFPTVPEPEAGHGGARERFRGAPAARKRSSSAAALESSAEEPAPAASSGGAAPKHRPGSFPALGLGPAICAALSKRGYGFPTPIQRRVIPSVLAGRDVVAMARTGSGKTAAFLAPVLQRLANNPRATAASSTRNGPRALVVAPTRELALQTLRFCSAYARGLEPAVRAAVIVGGTALEAQFEALAVCPEIVIATPGRLLQILAEMGVKGGLTLSCVETLVLDEADRLFEGTLAQETRTLIDTLTPEEVKNDRQTVLVSATMPRALADFTQSCLRRSVDVIRLDADRAISPTLAVAFTVTRSGDEKAAALVTVVRHILSTSESRSVVIFIATHRGVEYIVGLLRAMLPTSGPRSDHGGVVCVHGNLDQGARVEAVSMFRKGLARVLVVTDVAARGIDLPELDVVVNYDMAAAPKLFVHRVGRVGRAGRAGMAVSLIAADEAPYMIDTLLFLGRGVSLAGQKGHNDDATPAGEAEVESDPWADHSSAMQTSFVVGSLPSACVEHDVEALTKLVTENVELEKLRKSSMNAHGLYLKTRVLASGESVRRAKELYGEGCGKFYGLAVHPWFSIMESDDDRTARDHASRLSSWRPKELAVVAPGTLKRRRTKVRDSGLASHSRIPPATMELIMDGCLEGEQEEMSGAVSEHIELPGAHVRSTRGQPLSGMGENDRNVLSSVPPATAEKLKVVAEMDSKVALKIKKRSARQLAMEAQKAEFYVPLRRNESDVRNEQAFKLGGGSMADSDGLGAFRAVQDAKMDLVADTNVDMLRQKSQGKKDMFWDRVSKKYVKGGLTNKISKQNVHVATNEAKARSGTRDSSSYGSSDGSMFKAWLSKNQKVVDQMRESGVVGGQHVGIGSNDFRKGAYGRRARIAAIAARQRSGESDGAASKPATNSGLGFRSGRSELKSAPQIRKERKLKRKAEARRMAKAKGKGKQGGPVPPRPEKRGGLPSRSKTLVYKKGSR